MAEKIFDTQNNYGWGLTLNMTGKAPAVSKRIFDTLADAQAFADAIMEAKKTVHTCPVCQNLMIIMIQLLRDLY